MDMTFLTHRTRHETTHHALNFWSRENTGWGMGFDCDAAGNPVLTDANRANYERTRQDPAFYSPQVQTWKNVWYEPATIRCDCGSTLSLDDAMTNRCDRCGQFYNGSGQRLAHPSQWGEETGERFDDNGSPVL